MFAFIVRFYTFLYFLSSDCIFVSVYSLFYIVTELLCDTTPVVTYRFVALLPRGCNRISLEKSECSDRII